MTITAPSNGTPTSVAAAIAIEHTAETLRAAVFGFIVGRGEYGATDQEIQNALGMDGSTERPRRWELVGTGMVKDSGRTRQTMRGRQAVVWIAAGGEAC